MLKIRATWGWAATPLPPSIFRQHNPKQPLFAPIPTRSQSLNIRNDRNSGCCRARRRVRFENEEEEEEEEEEDEEGLNDYNPDIAMLELYTQSVKQEALIVRATVDGDSEEEILIFKGFSSSLSYGTSADPSKSILPSKAVVRSIDRVRGPFNPTDIQYIEKGLTLEDFKARLRPT